MRTRGSSRFETYYKVQWRDDISLTWRDVQRAYPSAAEAEAAFPPGRACRIMEVSMRGRRPYAHAATFQNSAPGDA